MPPALPFHRLRRILIWFAIVGMPATWAAENARYDRLVREGLIALERGEPAAARDKLERAVEMAPGDVRGWLGLAQARRRLGDASGADEAIAKVLETEQKAPWLAHMLAMYYAESEEFSKAAEFEGIYARSKSADRNAFLRASVWHLEAGRHDLAVEYARSGLEREESPELYSALGKALDQAGDLPGAEKALRAAIRLRPFDEDHRYDLGYLFLSKARFDEAAAAFEEAREVFDKSPQLELGIGVAHFGQRRFTEAVDSFLRVSALAPGLEQPHYFLSRALEHAEGRMREVKARFAAFAAARPGHYLGPFLQAKVLLATAGPLDSDAFQQAEELLLESIRLKDNFWESHFERGVVLDRLKRYAHAEQELLRAIELSPRSPTPHYRLARVYSRLGKRDKALEQAALHDRLVAATRDSLGLDGANPLVEPDLASTVAPE